MMAYLSYFKLRFITGLQYRTSALAGIITQIFFGFVFIMVYLAFYESNSSDTPMNLKALISYLWLNQSLFALICMWYKDKEILNTIKSGTIAYELCRPLDLYFMWFSKILSTRLSMTILRCIPGILFALLIPAPYNLSLPNSLNTFLLFFIALIIGILLMTAIVTLYHILTIFTLNEKGVIGIIMAFADIFSGLVVPLPFFPSFLKTIAKILPFGYVSDIPFRIYTSNINIVDAKECIIIQLIWILIITLIGYILSKIALKKAVIQGG